MTMKSEGESIKERKTLFAASYNCQAVCITALMFNMKELECMQCFITIMF